ncbi:hypothetical protein QYF48_11590 [Brevibacillus agri]|nr:hypothetical protein [Brevibacillus agri]MDN4093457.1 hypothetical protein [Brevibacillus agri]
MAVNEYSLPTSPQAVKLKDNELPVFEVQPDQNLASEFTSD